MTKKLLTSLALTLFAPGLIMAQTQAAPPPPQAEPPITVAAMAPDPPPLPEPPQASADGPRVWAGQERGAIVTTGGPGMGLRGPGPGGWWDHPGLIKRLGLTDDQVAKIKKIFLDHRLQLIDLHANLEKQEVLLQPMINADHPDESTVLAQIDKVAEARASLEKSDARMLFAVRDTLTPEQWQKLRQIRARMRRPRPMQRRVFRGRAGQRSGHVMRMRSGANRNGPDTAPAPPPPPPADSGSQQQ